VVAVNLGVPELLIILAVVVLLFGATRLPKLARSVGQAQKEFKKGVDEGASGEPETGAAAKTETDATSASDDK